MVIAILVLELFIANSLSLKDKRTVLKSLKDRVRNNFNISIAEIDHHDLWQRASLAVAGVGTDKKYLDASLNKVVEFIKKDRSAELVDYSVEFL